MLTRCVVCNGSIEPVFEEERIQQIFVSHQAPEQLNDEVLDVYQCNGCSQGYWWCEKPNSSASRVKSQATKLLELCIRGGVPISDDLGIFDYVDVEKIRNEPIEDDEDVMNIKRGLDVVQWLQSEEIQNPLVGLHSAYQKIDSSDESLPFTNVTSSFVGHLDYILYQKKSMKVTDLLYVPRTYLELNDLEIPNGHLLPSCYWPSDHLAIGGRFTLDDLVESQIEAGVVPSPPQASVWCLPLGSEEKMPTLVKTASGNPSTVTSHGQRCTCGCVPAIPGLFEMAELRKQARMKQTIMEQL
jgi:hypothetical protein